MKIKSVLTIAGSDSSGGAGIQADIKTITAHKLYAMSVITALTAQNTTGVQAAVRTDDKLCAIQLDSVFSDIFPDAVKTGMLPDADCIKNVALKLSAYGAKNIVLDPVMVSTSGHSLMEPKAAEALKELLFPIATVITPNIPEAEALCGASIHTEEDMLCAAKKIAEYTDAAILIKGGHSGTDANDLLYYGGVPVTLRAERIDNPNTHGTGCTLSSAIACGLALGADVETSARRAKEYVHGAICAGLDMGHGRGPLDHMYKYRK